MATLSHKTTILLSPGEYELLQEIAKSTQKTMGALIRAAIGQTYRHTKPGKAQKRWEKLFRANAPSGDWSDMEAEILKGRLS